MDSFIKKTLERRKTLLHNQNFLYEYLNDEEFEGDAEEAEKEISTIEHELFIIESWLYDHNIPFDEFEEEK